MASDALRRLAARATKAPAVPCTSDIIESGGDIGDNGDSLEKPRVFLSPNGAALGDTGDKSPPVVTNVTNTESSLVTRKPAELAAVTNVTNVTTENKEGGSESAAGQRSTDPEVEAHLAQLSPAAHTAFTGPPNGPAHAYLRQPDGRWSAAMPVRPPTFETRTEASLPICTGWCEGCGSASRWRADPVPGPGAAVTRWRCTRCDQNDQDALLP